MVPHPIGGIHEDAILEKAGAAVEELFRAITAPIAGAGAPSGNGTAATDDAAGRGRLADLLELPADQAALRADVSRRGWSDGLPVIAPTEERVAAMLEYSDRDPDEVLGVIAPRQGEATVHAVAVNAVMAGCEPRMLPILIAAVQGITRPEFNISGVNATTHPTAVAILVNGPIGREVGVHSGAGCFGPTFDANATIGRAMRLIQLNVGGASPGQGDRATMGTPAKFSLCFAENEEASPWEPFHTTRGFAADDSTVTVLASEAPHNIEDHGSNTAMGILQTVVGSISQAGSNNILSRGDLLLVLTKEHADVIVAEGWDRPRMQEFLFRESGFPVDQLSDEFLVHINERIDPETPTFAPGSKYTIAEDQGSIHIIVAGGVGKHSAWLPSFGNMSRMQTVAISDRDGNPVRSVEELRR